MMGRSRRISPALIAVLIAIGCGGGKPQSASAKTEGAEPTTAATPMAAAQAPAGGSSAVYGAATIQVVARFAGAAPRRDTVKMDADPACQAQQAAPVFSEDAVVDSQGGLKNVFVSVKQGLTGAFPSPTSPVTLEQAGCWYRPRVFGLQVSQPLDIVNSDATLHNVNAKPALNQPFNIAQPVKGMKTRKAFAKPEVMVKFKCNVHPWMSAYAGVVEHPFFGVTDEHGAAALSGLPAGTYVLEAWHEKFGTQSQTVSVADGETKTVEWTFQAQ